MLHPFEVLAHPARRRIVAILASGEASAGEIMDAVARDFGITQPTVAYHLRILRENSWVHVRAEWVNRMYRLNDDALTVIDTEVEILHQLWDRRIGSSFAPLTDPSYAIPIARSAPRPSRRGMQAGSRNNLWSVPRR